ncbi:large conductance mechanosensitive channel protein MscL [Nocardia sp. NPDC005978]|uniref:large conductance mechanosensitive channel protein MscL n=1 Tax=unclassified Nocardia TaxID=2637762 RepID=UPI0033ACF988
MFKGFKDFLMRGNVIDLAIAVVMGTAFTAIVTSVTKGLLEPLLAVLGGNSEFGLGFQIIGSKPATFVAVGPIISAVINFLTVAAVLYFILMVPMTHLQRRLARQTEIKADPTEIELLVQIRDLLVEQNSGKSETATTTQRGTTAAAAAAVAATAPAGAIAPARQPESADK